MVASPPSRFEFETAAGRAAARGALIEALGPERFDAAYAYLAAAAASDDSAAGKGGAAQAGRNAGGGGADDDDDDATVARVAALLGEHGVG